MGQQISGITHEKTNIHQDNNSSLIPTNHEENIANSANVSYLHTDDSQTILSDHRPVLSDKAKANIIMALHRSGAYNRTVEMQRTKTCTCLTQHIIHAHISNIEDLNLEIQMLRNTVDKYKTMYYTLHDRIKNDKK